MENRFNNRDFEQFIKNNADQYRMYPSERVWKGIHNNLHTRRRWYGIGLGFLILTAGMVTWVMTTNSTKTKIMAVKDEGRIVYQASPIPPSKDLVTAIPLQKNSFITPVDNAQKKLFPAKTGMNTGETPVPTEPSTASGFATTWEPEIVAKRELPAATTETAVRNNSTLLVPAPAVRVVSPEQRHLLLPVNQFSFVIPPAQAPATPVVETELPAVPSSPGTYPMTIESVVNSYTHIRSRKKVSLQLFITPTISYRKLDENKEFTNSARNVVGNGPASAYYYYSDINSMVTHKPDLGIQVGAMAGYPLGRNLTLIGGLQFNVSKYDIKAYTSPGEIATIALQNNAGGTNTVSTVTNYRNTGTGYFANWLHNLYFSASAPVGLEMKISSNRKSYVGMSATAQPTYVIGNRAYLISTDYKNYVEVPSLTRKWNFNAGFEVFAGNTTGKFKWRVGPQVRYQAESSFVNKYPVKEHLFDFGIKMGVFLSK